MSNGQESGVRQSLKELAEVSRDLDRHTQLSKTAGHPIQAQQVRKRIDELSDQQTTMMNALVAQHPSSETQEKYRALGAEVEGLKEKVRGCEDTEELVELEAKIDSVVDSWIHTFQVIVSEIAGVAPPSQPIYEDNIS